MVGMQNNCNAIGFSNIMDIFGTSDSAFDCRKLILIRKTLASKGDSSTIGKLNNDRRI